MARARVHAGVLHARAHACMQACLVHGGRAPHLLNGAPPLAVRDDPAAWTSLRHGGAPTVARFRKVLQHAAAQLLPFARSAAATVTPDAAFPRKLSAGAADTAAWATAVRDVAAGAAAARRMPLPAAACAGRGRRSGRPGVAARVRGVLEPPLRLACLRGCCCCFCEERERAAGVPRGRARALLTGDVAGARGRATGFCRSFRVALAARAFTNAYFATCPHTHLPDSIPDHIRQSGVGSSGARLRPARHASTTRNYLQPRFRRTPGAGFARGSEMRGVGVGMGLLPAR
eukprot:353436-Chlamydomonas_euryale.AAC.8